MRYKDTIRGAKKIIKTAKEHPNFYTEEELLYVTYMKNLAEKNLKEKKSHRNDYK